MGRVHRCPHCQDDRLELDLPSRSRMICANCGRFSALPTSMASAYGASTTRRRALLEEEDWDLTAEEQLPDRDQS